MIFLNSTTFYKENMIGIRRFIQPLLGFHTSAVQCAEPMKKKKKMDPSIIRHREQRKMKRIERSIRKLERVERPLKPLDETQIPLSLKYEIPIRQRQLQPISQDIELSQRELLVAWSHHKQKEAERDLACIRKLLDAQGKALKELKLESEELYIEATQLDLSLLPYKAVGPTRTPQIKGYDPPDGDYIDVSRKWE
ncbi:large ribosomal subunit protein mL40-like isoform X2 [Artemia franciscana]|uniref:large ribosomal subunit protein mL40-like isoform X2 n=1 Tax=Artemia franciscana TaxID=6661 RepID=UPI0032DADE6C